VKTWLRDGNLGVREVPYVTNSPSETELLIPELANENDPA